MTVVISYPEDPHATRVIDHLRAARHETALLDLSELPERATISVDYANPTAPQIWYQTNECAIRLDQATSVWWRRPQSPNSEQITDLDARAFIANEWNEAIHGMWHLLDANWMNPPYLDDRAGRKALQLRTAAECGLQTPRTLITSDPERARAFVDSLSPKRTIFKTFSATHAIWRETRIVGEAETALLETVRYGPVIFQECLESGIDLRVTIVGDKHFPAEIDARRTDYPTDFRMSLGQATVRPTSLPPAVTAGLEELMRRLGLIYGAVDLRLTPDGAYVFLEVNTAGEFLFIEERTGQPISRAIAEWLSTPGRR